MSGQVGPTEPEVEQLVSQRVKISGNPKDSNSGTSLLSRASSSRLRARGCLQILFLNRLTALDSGKREGACAPALQTLPLPIRLPICPCQKAHPRLHVPMQRQRRIGPLSHLARHICDLILGFLAVQPHNPRLRTLWIRLGRGARLRAAG